ncbi:hypothetical protein C5167_009891 [Papaver somniferum]|uniref:Amino acid transporter transmembrane domain-containing protein n=1 Tax=Papaver somniferum TaxID=3469 RepID=A0A4Y7K1K4_PAPSO|nr:hypothetical protein C5167_009891 [Papaver somniferum]
MAIEMQEKKSNNFSKGGHGHDPEMFNHQEYSKNFDDDGRQKRTGTLLTASAHIITAVIGSGVLSLAWAIAQLGWIAGGVKIQLCGAAQYANLVGVTIGYTITASISLA